MSFSFVKNDNTSFAQCSRVYEVYDFDQPQHLRTALVVGYLSPIEKYFITILGDNLLTSAYNLEYNNIGSTEYIKMLNEFFNYLSLMSEDDFIGPEYNSRYGDDEYFPPLLKSNFVLYISDIEPYYDEDLDEHDGIWSTSDEHSNYLLDNQIALPWKTENYDTDDIESYDYDNIMDMYYDNVSIGLYCNIDYELLNTYSL